jgi:tetratricopeptide (TPR) repeat protein
LGRVASAEGDYAHALDLILEGLTLHQVSQHAWGAAELTASLGFVTYAQGDYAQAVNWYRESLQLFLQLGMRRGQAICLEGLAQVASAQEHMERAARLMGAAAHLRHTLTTPLSPSERIAHNEGCARARAELGDQGFAVAWGAGESMPLDHAIAEALGEPIPASALSSGNSDRQGERTGSIERYVMRNSTLGHVPYAYPLPHREMSH